MANYNKILSQHELELLKKLEDKTLVSIEGHNFQIEPDLTKTSFLTMLRLNIDDGSAYDLRINFDRIDIVDQDWLESPVYSFTEAEGDIWLPQGERTTIFPVNRNIDQIVLVNDYDQLFCRGELVNSFAFTKAVLFRTGLEYLSLAMNLKIDEAIDVRQGFDPKELVPDNSASWYDEPGYTDEYVRKFVHI